jgi:hypothetical protein
MRVATNRGDSFSYIDKQAEQIESRVGWQQASWDEKRHFISSASKSSQLAFCFPTLKPRLGSERITSSFSDWRPTGLMGYGEFNE